MKFSWLSLKWKTCTSLYSTIHTYKHAQKNCKISKIICDFASICLETKLLVFFWWLFILYKNLFYIRNPHQIIVRKRCRNYFVLLISRTKVSVLSMIWPLSIILLQFLNCREERSVKWRWNLTVLQNHLLGGLVDLELIW